MSLYKTLVAAFMAAVLVAPVFADDEMTTPGTTETTTTSTTTTETTTTKIDLNKASVKELMTVKGINGPKARAIVAYRKKNGDFKTVDDLINVKGFSKMGDDKFKSIENQLTVE